MSQPLINDTVLQVSDVESDVVDQLLGRYGITLELVSDAATDYGKFLGRTGSWNRWVPGFCAP